MKKEITIDVFPDGEVRIETKGFQGRNCVEEAQFLKDILGTETVRKLTPAYYYQPKVKTKKYLTLCG